MRAPEEAGNESPGRGLNEEPWKMFSISHRSVRKREPQKGLEMRAPEEAGNKRAPEEV